MKIKIHLFLVLFLVSSLPGFANVYFVAPYGFDGNSGTLSSPFYTIQLALNKVNAGDTVYLRGGIYSLSATLTTKSSGYGGKYICMWAYQGENVILDFSGETYASASRGMNLTANYWYIKGLKFYNAGDNGLYISGGYNIVENCEFAYCKDTGLQISNGGNYNYIHNCDAYQNNDPATGGQNADGIDAKLDAGPGNVFRGCRCFDNADDGFDCYQTSYEVVFDSCWSFHNGYNLWNIQNFTGNGNGFKLGGNFVPGPHVVTNCVSFDNMVKGFDQNNNTAGVKLFNCTSFRNGTYDFSFPTPPSVGVDSLVNDLSYMGVLGVHLEANAISEHDTWNTGYQVTSNPFVNIDTAFARVPRLSSGYLPSTTFLRLDSTSTLIDTGLYVGIKYLGKAPDLGAFEYGSETFNTQVLSLSAVNSMLNVTLNWNVSLENGNSGWEIERAFISNGSPSVWQDVGFQPSLGDTAGKRSYSFNDAAPYFSTYFYRLKQISNTGEIVYSNTIAVTINESIPVATDSLPILVFPNPTNDYINIQFYASPSQTITIVLYNTLGQLMKVIVNNWTYSSGGVNNILYDTRALQAGVYYIRFLTDDGIKNTVKFVKE